MKKKIASALLAITMVLSAFIIVPMTYTVEAEAAYDPSLSMYQGSNIFTGEELSKLVYASKEVSYSYDSSGENALKITLTAFSDPYIYFNLSSAAIDLSAYTKLVVIYKLPLTNKQEWQRIQYFWWDTAGNYTQSDEYSSDYSYYRNGSYYYDVKTNNLTTGTLQYLRIDTSSWAAFWQTGDSLYIDSIAFFKTDAEAIAYRQERMSVRNKESNTFTISPSQLAVDYAFVDAHNVNVSYNSSENTFQLTTANNCSYVTSAGGAYSASCPNGGGKYLCWNAANNGLGSYDDYQSVLDPVVYLNCNVDTSKYKYAVISFMLPHEANASTLARAGMTADRTAIFDSRYSEGARNYASIIPQFSGSTYSITSTYQFGTEGYYYTQIIDLSAAGGDGLTKFRIDPFEYTFSKLGLSLHIKQITFATDASTAMSSAESMLASMTDYSSFNLGVTYNANALSGTTVSNLPSEGSPLQYVSIPGTASYGYSIPSTAPACSNSGVKFDGWATSSTGAAVVQPGETYTVTGATGTVTKPVLYGLWHHMYGTVNIAVNNTNANIDADQAYLFKISGTGLDPAVGEFSMTVPITSNGTISFDLPMGTYTITCLDAWSWRYGAITATQTATLSSEGQAQTVTFTYNSENESWLNGYGSN